MRDSSREELDHIVEEARAAVLFLRKLNIKQRAELMYKIAERIESLGSDLLKTAAEETNLTEVRLKAEKARTVLQWRQYADGLSSGNVLNVRIDHPAKGSSTPKHDLRKTYIPLGVVVVFGAGNFPFAYSTAGGDTASAIAAGCPVVVKAHPAHPKTSQIVADAISEVIQDQGYPKGIFGHVHGQSFETGKYLVAHPDVKAVGFTGSLSGGRALFDIACQREEPIPVFAEMGSVNPVFFLRDKFEQEPEALAEAYVGSLTLGSGQFCTNPGILCVPECDLTESFLHLVRKELDKVIPVKMLHRGIYQSYVEKSDKMISRFSVECIYRAEDKQDFGYPVVVRVAADQFISDRGLQEEIFGPFGMIVTYRTSGQLGEICRKLQGQLTCSLFGTGSDFYENQFLIYMLSDKCGRVNFNSFPTGVQVDYAMQHGGPYPASTDSRFTAVGPDAIRRFARPVTYQNCPDELLPDELKNNNPLKLNRMVNGEMTDRAIEG